MPPGEGEFDCAGFVRLLTEIGVRVADLARGLLDRAVGRHRPTRRRQRAADGMRAVLAEAADGA